MRIYWKHNIRPGGDGYGFYTATNNIKKCLEAEGFILSKNADICMSHVSPHIFEPEPDMLNILWPPIESDDIVASFVSKLNSLDAVIASCQHNADVFKKSGVTVPVYVLKLGINPAYYPYRERVVKDKLRILWLGMPSERKGYDIVIKAFCEAFTMSDPVELYMKTTAMGDKTVSRIGDNITVDSRHLATADVIDLYEWAHVFVLPSRGEGTGLTALEAMASGCLVMAPDIQGLKDFITPDKAIVLRHDYIRAHYGKWIMVPNVDYRHLRDEFKTIIANYDNFKSMRKHASEWVHENMSWKMTGQRLKEILKEVYDESLVQR